VAYVIGLIFIGIAAYVAFVRGIPADAIILPAGLAFAGILLVLAGRFLGERGLKWMLGLLTAFGAIASILKGRV
jgi:hypothetical protein